MPRLTRAFSSVCVLVALVAGCAAPPASGEFHDPYETQNRAIHDFNKRLDSAMVGPSANAYGTAIPKPVREGVSNFSANLNLPGQVVNGVLQGRPGPATRNTLRFILNSTLGLGGLFDPATEFALPAEPTDFGETLHVWGVGEGAYLEVPLLGPSTQRDLLGSIVDLGLNPLNFVLNDRELRVASGARLLSRFSDRYRYSGFIDEILYQSADSYAQARLLYLHNRRFQLGQQTDEDAYDPYADPYGE